MMWYLGRICTSATVILLFLSGMVVSGSHSAQTDQLPSSAKVSSIVTGKTLVIAMANEIEVMDPAKTASMYGPPSMIYETLISRDPTGTYVPGLATSWNMNRSDPVHPTFDIQLKTGVKFHDGLAFDTYAVKRIINYQADNYSWNEYVFFSLYGCMNKTGWPNAAIWCKDAYNMTLNLTWADASLVFNLSTLYGAMMSPDALESEGLPYYGIPGHKVVGTGPFMLSEWVANDHVTLVKNPNYTWGAPWYANKGPANIDKVIYRMIPDQATRFAAFESGAIDVLEQVPANKILPYGGDSTLTLMSGPGQGTYHVDFNCQRAPWNNATLRSAFAYAVNRTQILQVVWHGVGQEGVNYLSPIEPESTRVPALFNFTYDPAKSQSLFSAAGFADTDSDGWLENSSTGEELTLQLWTTNKGEDVIMSELLLQQFGEVGVHVQLTQYEEIELRTLAWSGLHEAILYYNSWPRADILDWNFGTWAMGGSNLAWFSDPVFDAYVVNWTYAETAQQWSDNATLGHIRLLTKSPRVPLLFWHQITAVHNCVTGWYLHPWGGELPFDILDVDVDHGPIAVVTQIPSPVQIGDTVTFDASDSSDDVGIVNFTWTISDGLSSIDFWGETVNREMTSMGDFDITLTVRDNVGQTGTFVTSMTVTTAIPELPSIILSGVAIIAVVLFFERLRRSSNR